MRWLLLITALLALLTWFHSIATTTRLDWLSGSWHDADHQATRLIFSKPCQQGVTGLLITGPDTTVLAIQPDGLLTMRVLGPNLRLNTPPQQFPLLHQGPLEFRYSRLSLRYVNARTEGPELLLEMHGRTLRLQPD